MTPAAPLTASFLPASLGLPPEPLRGSELVLVPVPVPVPVLVGIFMSGGLEVGDLVRLGYCFC